MIYRHADPHPCLRPYIEGYWWLQADTGANRPFQEAVFVDGKADLIFNFGVPYQRVGAGVGADVIAASNLDAQRFYPITMAQIGSIRLIGVRFCLGGLSAFLRVPMGELVDRVLDTESAFGRGVRELEGRLFDSADNATAQTALLDEFFLSRLALDERARPVHALIDHLIGAGGRLSVQAMSAHVGYSARTLTRLFMQFTGFTPKQTMRIVRLSALLHTLNHDAVPLIEGAARHGYSDQAHMTHEVRLLTGMTPAAYRVRFLQDASNGLR